jgi:HSP20 family molecular chaperone IbpA
MKYLIVPLLGAVVLTGCSKTVSKQEMLVKRFEYNQEQVEDTTDDIPKWFLNIPTEEGFTYAVGTAETPDLQLAVDIAVLNAKTTLADSMNSRVRSQTKSFISKLGSDDVDASVMSEVEKATRNVVLDADVSGWQQKELDIQASGPQYRAYVLLEYSDVRASTFLHDRLTKDNNLYTKIKSTKAFEELDEAVRQQNEIELEKLRIAAE